MSCQASPLRSAQLAGLTDGIQVKHVLPGISTTICSTRWALDKRLFQQIPRCVLTEGGNLLGRGVKANNRNYLGILAQFSGVNTSAAQ
ncbi:unnamed protein product [Heligmosomoides polygyrus]|uniref:FAD-binding oxidoreductase n=1 Tax=Heligmosomoides polygyrus TaxID=6339 RepID=A0A183GA38_HELPZ|nr:unnamed protein product [Heligmosomoides polygyrus]